VALTLDGKAVPVVDETKDWTSWHADVTFATPGAHTLIARATNDANGQATATLKLNAQIDVPILTCAKPKPDATQVIVTQLINVPVEISVQTLVARVNLVEYQLGGGPQTPLSPPDATSPNWHGTVVLPTPVAALNGTSYALALRATTDLNTVGTTALTLKAVDGTKPTVAFTPDNGQALQGGVTVAVTARVSDQPGGVVTSGIGSVTAQLDAAAPVAATQTAPGDPSTWLAALGPLSHDFHQITVVATDVQGNSTSAVHNCRMLLDSWSRLEPLSRDPSLMEGLQARIADPLWLLSRQAAFGEFTGHDAASPVTVRLRGRYGTLTRVRPAFTSVGGAVKPATGPGELLPHDAGPLEALTEAEEEPGPGVSRPLFSAHAGLHYLRLLRTTANAGDISGYVKGLIGSYPFPPSVTAAPGVPPAPDANDPLLTPYAGNVPDGARLYEDLAKAFPAPARTGSLPAAPATGAANAAVVTAVARRWLDWYDAVAGRSLGSRDTWRPDRMEYAFSTAAPGPDAETVLAAEECDTGELDWFDFDLLASSKHTPASADVSLGAVAADRPDGKSEDAFVFVGFPTPVTFRGMPSRRWWDFDDASIDFGAISAPVEDVTTSLIVEFALRYANDQFMIPVQLGVGSICRIDSLVVTDTFGELLAVRSIANVDGANGPFRLFEHTLADPGGKVASNRDPLFVLFPTVGEIQTGTPIEEVHFVRDEAAEILWAIEQTALGRAGVPADRNSEALAHFMPLVPTPNDGSTLPVRTYVLRTDVEQNWFPFLLPDDTSGTMLHLADVPSLDGRFTPLPWGRILAPFMAKPPLGMPQEEVTRAGAQVVRAWRYARWIDGRQLSWVGRRVRPSRGPGSSGLSFDLAV
jgi:hypothetical protein